MMWSGWMSKQSHMGDDSWTFGDFLNMSLLGAAVLSVVNAWNGESGMDPFGLWQS